MDVQRYPDTDSEMSDAVRDKSALLKFSLILLFPEQFYTVFTIELLEQIIFVARFNSILTIKLSIPFFSCKNRL